MSDKTNAELIRQASDGNMTPLLDELRKGTAMSAGTGGNVSNDGESDTDLWMAVQGAVMDGDLTTEQERQCFEAATE